MTPTSPVTLSREEERTLRATADRSSWFTDQGHESGPGVWWGPTMVGFTHKPTDAEWLAQAFREAVSEAHEKGTKEEPHWSNVWARKAAAEGNAEAQALIDAGKVEDHVAVEDADYNCRHPWCVRFWPMVRAAEARAKLEAEAASRAVTETPEAIARKHYERDRHFYEGDGEQPCTECGEDQDADFLRITVHYNDGDG